MPRLGLFFCFLFSIFFASVLSGQTVNSIIVNSDNEVRNIQSGIEALEDTHHNISFAQAVASRNFKMLPQGIPNENVTSSAFWFRVKIRNETNRQLLVLKLSNPTTDSLAYYEMVGADSFRSFAAGESLPFAHREYLSSDFLFAIHILPGAEKYIYLHIYSCNSPLILPLAIGTEDAVRAADKYKDIFWGMYIGLMLAMLAYNGFVYISTKDNSYLYYLLYMLAVLLTQITVSGYAFQLLWPNSLTV